MLPDKHATIEAQLTKVMRADGGKRVLFLCVCCANVRALSLSSQIQATLLDLGAHVATPRSSSKDYRLRRTRFVAAVTTELEQAIDAMDDQLPALKNFVLPVRLPRWSCGWRWRWR